jgi:NADPH2:quinone reductase
MPQILPIRIVQKFTVHVQTYGIPRNAPRRHDNAHGHSAAGGLGSLLLRWSKARGAIVVAAVSSDAKAHVVRELGADHVIVGRQADFAAEVARITNGRGVDVAYDGVGGSTLEKTLACVRPFGTVASYGEAAGPIPPLRVEDLGPKRSLVLARPSVMHFMSEPDTYRAAAQAVVAGAREGLLAAPGAEYRFDDFARAHADLEAGLTTGSTCLVIDT